MSNETVRVALEPRHDFTAKLGDPRVLPVVQAYVEWQRARRGARERGEPDVPVPLGLVPPAIQLDLTTACNSACPGCIDRDALNRKEQHDYAQLLETLEYQVDHGLRSVILIGGGEPTIHPRFGDMVRFLKGHGVQVGIVSNGLYPKPIVDVAGYLAPPDWVRISLDAGTNETFQALRKPRHPVTLEDVCERVGRIRMLNPDLSLGFSFVISWPGSLDMDQQPLRENLNEMVLAARLARETKFTYISFKAYLTRDHMGSEAVNPDAIVNLESVIRRIRENLAAAKQLETQGFEVSVSKNLRAILDNTWKNLTNQPRTCHKQALQWVLSPLGTFNCPAMRGEARGRITGPAPWSEGREGATREALRQILDRFDASHECATTVCFYNDMNWWLDDLVAGLELPEEGVPATDCFL